VGVGRLAVNLDAQMLTRNVGTFPVPTIAGLHIAPPETRIDQMIAKDGPTVAQEIGSRYLLKYLLSVQVGRFLTGTSDSQHVTPTPFSREEMGAVARPS
jgi:hypothetical protein